MVAKRARTIAEPADRVLVIKRILDAPRVLVWKTWTDPEHRMRWWGPTGFTTHSCTMDVRPGGAWRLGMRSPEGIDYWQQGVYREIFVPERLVFTYAFEDGEGGSELVRQGIEPGHQTLVTVTFVERGRKTEMTVHQAVFESVGARDDHQRGWTESLDRFAAYVTRLHGATA
jgi:uncharacterized protein YndB with AHSA1/START domain